MIMLLFVEKKKSDNINVLCDLRACGETLIPKKQWRGGTRESIPDTG
jgi:hypothetical protein